MVGTVSDVTAVLIDVAQLSLGLNDVESLKSSSFRLNRGLFFGDAAGTILGTMGRYGGNIAAAAEKV
ncbi:hypothetical protein QA601_16020 [Chitinispirillales bacterium ANBcel5]|uniref:hypothetical protein n=1 Tax=Cellulosispirillum alkaliphilum TaxID=3039283 RepID=UPI002A4FCC88|nr:hypothetical protein [Chitinispirillales bacterium ANBcel5]